MNSAKGIDKKLLVQLIDDELRFVGLLRIKNKLGQIVPFTPNRAQIHFYQSMTGRDIILKARQLGFSTFIQGLNYKKVTMHSGRAAVTISKDGESTLDLREKFKLFYRLMPEQIRPEMERNDKIASVFPRLFSSSTIMTAGSNNAGRGRTIHHLHVSEVAFWEKPEILMKGLLEAVPPSAMVPYTTVAIESTPNGAGGYFYDICMNAMKGIGEYKLHFYPWWWDDLYQIKLDKNEVIVFDPDELALVQKFNLTPEQIKWRRHKMAHFQQFGNKEEFYQEYPEDPETCFLVSGRPRFDREALRLRLNAQCQDPIETWWEGRISIFETPEAGKSYVIGADPSEGIGQDSGSAIVREWESNCQVATLHGNNFELAQYSYWLQRLAIYFNNAYIGVERNNHGHTVIDHFKNGIRDLMESYTNLYTDPTGKIGWHTNAATRPVMIDHLAEEYGFVDAYIMRDSRCVRQAMNFVQVNGRAEGKKHDDFVMADAIAGEMRRMPRGKSYQFITEEEMLEAMKANAATPDYPTLY